MDEQKDALGKDVGSDSIEENKTFSFCTRASRYTNASGAAQKVGVQNRFVTQRKKTDNNVPKRANESRTETGAFK